MLFNLQNLLPKLVCALAIGQLAESAPHGNTLNSENGLEKRVKAPNLMTHNSQSGAFTIVKRPNGDKYDNQQISKNKAKAYARRAYLEYVQANNPHASEAILMSSLYVPNEGIFVSSYAQRRLPTESAPTWTKAVEGRKNIAGGHSIQHVEDAALWLFESTVKPTLGDGKYPAGSTIYTYGQYEGKKADDVKACGSTGAAKIDPSCTTILSVLGVDDGNNILS